METKKALAVILTLSGTTAAGFIAAPKAVLNAVPTATVVNVATIEHEDSISLSGTIVRDLIKDDFSVQMYVPEQDISKIRIGQSAEITGDAFPDTTYEGTVEKISDVASKVQSGNVQKTVVEVTVRINSPDKTLKHGYTASVKLCTSEPSLMTIVPYEAVDQDDNGEYVYFMKNGRAYKRYVETGREFSDGIELKTVFSEDEAIITVDRFAADGSAVKIGEE